MGNPLNVAPKMADLSMSVDCHVKKEFYAFPLKFQKMIHLEDNAEETASTLSDP